MVKRLLTILTLVLLAASPLWAQEDPLDPFDNWTFDFDSEDPFGPSAEDDNKSAEQLVREATILLQDERLLDARTKLLKALKNNPRYYQAHILLSGYYLRHVGHFRLALKYIKRALQVFEEENGSTPYSDLLLKQQHAHMLYIYSQARLNLDDYQGALDILDEYESYGYYHDWYPGSRAWILMKLDRVDEAVKTARQGIMQGAEPGRTLNMLAILLSLSGEREESLRIFKEAIRYELSLGTMGQPATPLNNSGEVYKEIFFEDKAENSWLKATSLPDGCEHVLPSLNLALLYIDQLNFKGAKKALDNFEACYAQYPLRNDEEHRALVHLGRGRIALHTGHIDEASNHLEAAVDRRQWFGKIGTSQDDLLAGALQSLGQALESKNNSLKYKVYDSFLDKLSDYQLTLVNSLRSWWSTRKASQVLVEDLNDFEDLHIRHTDSMLEYTTIGRLTSRVASTPFKNRIESEEIKDPRGEASIYYKAYLGENKLRNGNRKEGLKLINEALQTTRTPYDNLLKVHLLAVKYLYGDLEEKSKIQIAKQIYNIHHPAIRNYGLKLSADLSKLPGDLRELLEDTLFTNSSTSPFIVELQEKEILFKSPSRSTIRTSISYETAAKNLNEFIQEIFSQAL